MASVPNRERSRDDPLWVFSVLASGVGLLLAWPAATVVAVGAQHVHGLPLSPVLVAITLVPVARVVLWVEPKLKARPWWGRAALKVWAALYVAGFAGLPLAAGVLVPMPAWPALPPNGALLISLSPWLLIVLRVLFPSTPPAPRDSAAGD